MSSIRSRLLALISGLILAVMAVYAGAAYVEVRRSMVVASSERLEKVTAQLGGVLAASIGQMRSDARALGRDSSIVGYLEAQRRVGAPATVNVLATMHKAAQILEKTQFDTDRFAVEVQRAMSGRRVAA